MNEEGKLDNQVGGPRPKGQDQMDDECTEGERINFPGIDGKRVRHPKKLGWHDDSEILEINEADEDDEAGSQVSNKRKELGQSSISQSGPAGRELMRSRTTSKQIKAGNFWFDQLTSRGQAYSKLIPKSSQTLR